MRSCVALASASAISASETAFLTCARSRAWFTSGSTRASTWPRVTRSPSRTSSSTTLPESTDFTSTLTCGSTEPTSVTRTCTSPTSAFAVLILPFSSSAFALGRDAAKPAPAIATARIPIQIRLRTRFPFDFAMSFAPRPPAGRIQSGLIRRVPIGNTRLPSGGFRKGRPNR